ncbi:MAG: UDP-N-acetylmuramoyl-L-alanine--D-glutamate ligase [Chloroflexi bacterium]|nr:UDP-N-acetylmuramoyl-L-alanine--D-glutamate ligase [Chloroflexota bacterium]
MTNEQSPFTIRNSRVVILGLARQGTALARFLALAGAEVTVSDLQDEVALADYLAELADLPIRYVLGEHPLSLLDKADLLCLSGGVPVDVPIVVEAQRRGILLSNDAQIFLEQCPASVIGITGSAGKTTTTALVGEMCRAAGLRTWVGGNIGNPLIADLDQIRPGDWVVMELSSFQLEVMTVSPRIAAVLNVTPNHLDRHKTMEAYTAAKRNIVAHQRPEEFALLGYDDANARALALETAAHLLWFSGGAEVDEGAFRTNGELTLRLGDALSPRRPELVEESKGSVDRVICQASEVRLRGRHNLLNVLAASALAGLAGVPVEAMRQVATTFTGVEHRLELVRELNGVCWYDDSIATAPERSLAALRSFEEPIVLLAGGRDKKLPWGEFADETVRRVRHLVTFGEAGPMIARVVQNSQFAIRNSQFRLEGITQVGTMEEAVAVAARLARPDEVVLLSPGGTSFDAFRDFAERGDKFKELVRGL